MTVWQKLDLLHILQYGVVSDRKIGERLNFYCLILRVCWKAVINNALILIFIIVKWIWIELLIFLSHSWNGYQKVYVYNICMYIPCDYRKSQLGENHNIIDECPVCLKFQLKGTNNSSNYYYIIIFYHNEAFLHSIF